MERLQEKGAVPLDVLFSPVQNASIEIENVRIGYRNDYEKILLTINTNGLLSPSDALGQAAKIIKEHMDLLINFDELLIEKDDGTDQKLIEMKKLLSLSIEELELSSRSFNCLRAANIDKSNKEHSVQEQKKNKREKGTAEKPAVKEKNTKTSVATPTNKQK
ncbi:DNA-directed RNA polymerase subunit alpha-like [Ylistrum balloti]|uniref:DNA-directed RNA polymerase subunit alpha-like n=1 Tax=Ylistrum balloti TaxID=509963 RepID=UPI0029058BDD|nr:DNA-directed RNA polymerase subunit alpha-like [Ylistrum balloti]